MHFFEKWCQNHPIGAYKKGSTPYSGGEYYGMHLWDVLSLAGHHGKSKMNKKSVFVLGKPDLIKEV